MNNYQLETEVHGVELTVHYDQYGEIEYVYHAGKDITLIVCDLVMSELEELAHSEIQRMSEPPEDEIWERMRDR